MAKYIIEFEDEPSMREDGVNYYTCKSARWYKLEDTIINRLEPYTDPDRKDIEDEVWKFAKKIGSFNGLAKHDLDECFGHTTIQGVMTTYDTYQEAKEKYEAWRKQKDEICVGDEIDIDGEITVVTMVNKHGEILSVDCGGMTYYYYVESQLKRAKKTGRHFFEVEDLLKKMKEQ